MKKLQKRIIALILTLTMTISSVYVFADEIPDNTSETLSDNTSYVEGTTSDSNNPLSLPDLPSNEPSTEPVPSGEPSEEPTVTPTPTGEPSTDPADDPAPEDEPSPQSDNDLTSEVLYPEFSLEKSAPPNVSGSTAADIAAAIEKVTSAIAALTGNTADLSKLAAFLQRFGGIASAGSCAISILQMMGIIEDPTAAALASIKAEIISVEDKLRDMDTKLDGINKSLTELAASEEEKSRRSQTTALLSNWYSFNTDYTEKLHGITSQYQAMINLAFNAWWNSPSHNGLRVYYTQLSDGSIDITYSKAPVIGALPDYSDNNEAIRKDKCIGIPSEYMPATSTIPYDANTYQATFQTLISDSILRAANDKKLEASDDFYKEWETLSDDAKAAKASSYANDALSSLSYIIACDAMSAPEAYKWTVDAMDTFKNYCDRIMSPQSGVDAYMNVLYLTHGFEGEIKSDIDTFFTTITATTGYYGSAVINAASQCSLVTNDERQLLNDTYVNVINRLDSKHNSSITGHDNYCYIVGKLVDFKELEVVSTSESKYWVNRHSSSKRTARGFSSTGWTIADIDHNVVALPAILSDTYSIVLYHQFLSQSSDDGMKTYPEYLGKYNIAIPADFKSNLLTSYAGSQTFALMDNLNLKCRSFYGDYFSTGTEYQIYPGNMSKIKNDYFVTHDKAVGNYITIDGDFEVNQVLAAKAAYYESHLLWYVDEGHVFYNCEFSNSAEKKNSTNIEAEGYEYTDHSIYYAPVYMLALSDVPAADIKEDSPLLAFDSGHIMKLEEEPFKPVKSDADWSKAKLNDVYSYEDINPSLFEGVNEIIDIALSKANEAGLNVNLSGSEREKIVKELSDRISSLGKELNENTSIIGGDIFGIKCNDAAMTLLAKAVLSDTYLDGNGEPKISAKNMDTLVSYEPHPFLEFMEKDGNVTYEIYDGFDIDPMLIIWNYETSSFETFEIDDAVMSALSLTAEIKIPAASLSDKGLVNVTHFDENLKVTEDQELPIIGSGSNAYVEFITTGFSPFRLKEAKDKPIEPTPTVAPSPTVTPSITPSVTPSPEVKPSGTPGKNTNGAATGDTADITLWLILILFAAALVSATIIYRRKRS